MPFAHAHTHTCDHSRVHSYVCTPVHQARCIHPGPPAPFPTTTPKAGPCCPPQMASSATNAPSRPALSALHHHGHCLSWCPRNVFSGRNTGKDDPGRSKSFISTCSVASDKRPAATGTSQHNYYVNTPLKSQGPSEGTEHAGLYGGLSTKGSAGLCETEPSFLSLRPPPFC